MLIHAAKDEVDNNTPEDLAAARGPAEHWEVPKGGHTAGIRTMPQEDASRVRDFFDRVLGAQRATTRNRTIRAVPPVGPARRR